MKALIFIREIFRKFPFLLLTNAALSLVVGFLAIISLFAIGPIVDFSIHPDLHGASPLTLKALGIMHFFGIPPTLGNWLIIFIFFIVISSFFHIFAQRAILKTKYAVVRDIITGTFEDFFNARWYFFSSSRQGVLLNTFVREITVVGDAFSAMCNLFANSLQTVFYLIVPFCISWQVSVISITAAVLFVIPFIFMGRISYRLGKLNTSTSNDVSSFIHENLGLAKIVMGFGNQNRSIGGLQHAFDAHVEVSVKSQILNIVIPLLYRPFGYIMLVIALIAARAFAVPISEMTVLLFALLQVAVSVGILATQKNSLENFFPSYEQIKNLRERAKQLKQGSGLRQFKGFEKEIVFEDVTFRYPDHEPVLLTIRSRIPKGKMIAFVGDSGAGKTTLIDIIVGFHEPTAGRITIDGVPLNEYDIQSYRKKIGYVPQDSVLFNMTVRDNLLWANEIATDDDIARACREANAQEFINGLQHGYDTPVGDRGVRLSGGQVQRIALARAILRKPDLLILDEATSSLDSASERMIQEAVERIAKETTIVVVAHRLSTIVNADYIYVIKKGRIVEEGEYSRLVQIDGHFNQMVKLQLLETGKNRNG